MRSLLLVVLVLWSGVASAWGLGEVVERCLKTATNACICTLGNLLSLKETVSTDRFARTNGIRKVAVLASLYRELPYLQVYDPFLQGLNQFSKEWGSYEVGRGYFMGPGLSLRLHESVEPFALSFVFFLHPGEVNTPHNTNGLERMVDWAAKQAGLHKDDYLVERFGELKYHPQFLRVELKLTMPSRAMVMFQALDRVMFPEDMRVQPNGYRWADTFRYYRAADPSELILKLNATRDNKQSDAEGNFIQVRLRPGETLEALKEILVHENYTLFPDAPIPSRSDELFQVQSALNGTIEATSLVTGLRQTFSYQVELSPEGNTYTIRLPKTE